MEVEIWPTRVSARVISSGVKERPFSVVSSPMVPITSPPAMMGKMAMAWMPRWWMRTCSGASKGLVWASGIMSGRRVRSTCSVEGLPLTGIWVLTAVDWPLSSEGASICSATTVNEARSGLSRAMPAWARLKAESSSLATASKTWRRSADETIAETTRLTRPSCSLRSWASWALS